MNDFFDQIAVWLTPIGLVLTWLFTKRHFQKKNLKLKDGEIEDQGANVVSKNLKIYQNMLDDIEKRYEAKLAQRDLEIKLLNEKIDKLIKKVAKLEAKK